MSAEWLVKEWTKYCEKEKIDTKTFLDGRDHIRNVPELCVILGFQRLARPELQLKNPTKNVVKP